MLSYGVLGFFVYLVLRGVIGWSIGIKYRFLRTRSTRPALSGFLIAGSVMFIIYSVVSSKDHETLQAGLIVIGYMLATAGLLLSSWAQLLLDESWLKGIGTPRSKKLVTSGPYRIIRHPMYIGVFLSSIGLGIAGTNRYFFFGMVLYGLTFVVMAPFEERLMVKKFGNRYRMYRKSTGMFLPGI